MATAKSNRGMAQMRYRRETGEDGEELHHGQGREGFSDNFSLHNEQPFDSAPVHKNS